MLKIKPLNDFVILQWEKKKKSKSGIVLSDVSNSKPSVAKIVAVGPGRLDRNGNYVKTKLSVGNTVLVDPFVPQSIKIDGNDFWVARESDIWAVI